MAKPARFKPEPRLRLLNAGSRIGMLRGGLPLLPREELGKDAEGAERARMYNTARWQALRARVLREQPACCACGAPATVADHIHGHGDEAWRERFYDRASVQAMCASCHNRKTVRTDQEGAGGRRRASLVRLPKVKGWDGSC